jgi:hypothetical protein
MNQQISKLVTKIIASLNEFRGLASKKRTLILENANFDDQFLMKILPNSTEFFNHFRKNLITNNPFRFGNERENSNLIKIIESDYPNFKQEILLKASRILKNEFEILKRKHSFRGEIDWFYSFFNDFSWPFTKSAKINWIVDHKEDIDIKHAIRFNYHQEFIVLGIAYFLTNDQKYVIKFLDLILDWIKKNPINWGINYTDTMEMSHRVHCWIIALLFFVTSELITQKELQIIAKSLLLQVMYIKNKINKKNYNHLIGESYVVFFFFSFFRNINFFSKIYQKYAKLLVRQIARQTQSDGVNIEQSTYYHRLVLEIFSLFYIVDHSIFSHNQIELIKKKFVFLKYLIQPDSTIPIIGDSDDSHFIPPAFFLGGNINMSLLELGDFLFNHLNLYREQTSGTPMLILLLKEDLNQKSRKIPKGGDLRQEKDKNIKYFNSSGYLIGKSDWKKESNYIFFDMGQFGPPRSGHDHSDISNIIYCFKGNPILIDSGTYMYNIDSETRNKFRSSRAHNIVSINDKNQAHIVSRWRWTNLPKIRRMYIEKEDSFHAIVQHNGYGDFLVSRKISSDKNLDWIKITESVKPTKNISETISVMSYFHFPNNLELKMFDTYIVINSTLKLELIKSKGSFKLIKSKFPCSNYYGIKELSHIIEFKTEYRFSNNPLYIEFLISPLN